MTLLEKMQIKLKNKKYKTCLVNINILQLKKDYLGYLSENKLYNDLIQFISFLMIKNYDLSPRDTVNIYKILFKKYFEKNKNKFKKDIEMLVCKEIDN